MTYPKNIVRMFGGPVRMSKLTGYPVNTINSWTARGAIHDEHKPRILGAARQHGIALTPADFFPDTDEVLPTAAR